MRGSEKKRSNFIYKKRRANLVTVMVRITFLLLMIIIIASLVYTFRDHYEDSQGDGISYPDAVYFTVMSITTTGYGDIVPVSESARIFDTVLITIGRAVMWFVIVGTTYQFIYDRYREAVMMKTIQRTLKDHILIVGYTTSGQTTADELVARGSKKRNIVVITTNPDEAQLAADDGFISINGDASKETVLMDAMIEKASSIIISTRKDDNNILISLTAKYLNPDIRVISQVTDLENIKLLKKSGVETIIAPAVTSGSLMATATSQPNVVHLLEDVMTSEKGMYLSQREVKGAELGKDPRSLKGIVVLGVVRADKVLSLEKMDRLKLREGDHLLIMDDK